MDNREDRIGDPSTIHWWAEISENENEIHEEKWCCKIIKETDFEEFIESIIGVIAITKFKVNYCPMCGRALRKPVVENIHSKACCHIIRDTGIEAIQFEEFDGTIHRFLINYCFNCGSWIDKVKRPIRYEDDYDGGLEF